MKTLYKAGSGAAQIKYCNQDLTAYYNFKVVGQYGNLTEKELQVDKVEIAGVEVMMFPLDLKRIKQLIIQQIIK